MEKTLFLIYIFEILGTIAFSISGAIVAMRHKLDLFGVIVLGCTTATGGGIMRDIFMGELPPRTFLNSEYLVLSFITIIIVFFIAATQKDYFLKKMNLISQINTIFDAIGLGTFSVTGVQIAINSTGYNSNMFLSIFLGVITAIGGGIVRDILCCQVPYIFKKELYATVAIIGSFSYYYFYKIFGIPDIAATFMSVILVFVLRILTFKYKWELPILKDL